MPTDHALLAPSAAKRWLTCTPSARVEALMPERVTPYAEEGTMAHAVAESLLKFYDNAGVIAVFDDPWDQVATFFNADRDLNTIQSICEDKGFDFQEIFETVHDRYVKLVWEDFVKARAEYPDAVLLIEQRVDLNDFVPDSFGSSDAIIIAGKTLHVYDLKYGRGVRVSAMNNPQMMLYALGALVGPGETYPIDRVEMAIIQPRLNAYSRFELSTAALAEWAAKTLVPAARLAYQGLGDYVPGQHCEFCRAKATCKALAEYCSRVTTVFKETDGLLPDEIAKALPAVAVVEMWASAVKARAMEMLSEGQAVPGWKLVEGRATRKILREGQAREILRQAGFGPEEYDKVELRGITDLTKLVGGAKNFNALLGELVEKTPGKPALAPESDPRPAYSPAVSAEDSFGSML